LIDRIRRNPLFRALRVDKLTIAVLEVALRAYLRGAYDEIPALRMIRLSADEIERRAQAFIQKLNAGLPAEAAKVTKLEVIRGFSVIGGGSTPDQSLPTSLIAVTSRHHSATQLELRLRQPAAGLPVIARIEDDRLVLDLRTVFPEQEPQLVSSLATALH
jgi:L-seryl-tRNA(Ser) seleniumtransferase